MTNRKNAIAIVATAALGASFGMIDNVAEATIHGGEHDSAVLDGLLADLDIADEGSQTIEADPEFDEDSANAIAAQHAIYEAQAGDVVIGDAPSTDPSVIDGTETKEAKAIRVKAEKVAAKAAKKVREDAAAAKKAAKAAEPPKAPRATSVTHKPGDLLVAKLGAKWREVVVFTDAERADTLVMEASQDEFISRMNDGKSIAGKVTEKIAMLFGFLQNGGELNEVLKRAFTVLHATGELTSGDKGNLQVNLLSKPYSIGTARSQANQMFMAFPELRLTVKEKGKMVANPNSILLSMVNAKLGLT